MSERHSLIEAIAAHRAAWEAFQNAPGQGKEAQLAEDAESDAILAMLRVPATSTDDVAALADHLRWFVVEEKQRAGILEYDLAAAMLGSLLWERERVVNDYILAITSEIRPGGD